MKTTHVTRRRFLQQTGRAVAGGLVAQTQMTSSLAAPGDASMRDVGHPDVIFIGAGINSLGAALELSLAGWRVLVLDRNATPGGAVRTMELTLPGFRHDIGAMNLGTFVGSPFYANHRDALADKGLEFIVADHSFGSFAEDGRFLGISTNQRENLRSIARFARSDVEAWRQWRADFEAVAPTLFNILGSPATDSGPMELIFGKADSVPEEASAVLRGILLESLRKNLSRRFESGVVQAMIAAWAMHLDYAPDVAGGCWMPFIETNVDELNGIPIARGGSGQMIRALVELIEDAGGLVLTRQSVQRIMVRNGRATGVQIEGGGTVSAAKGVVASVTPQALVNLAKGHLPKHYVEQAQAYRYGPGTMVIHLALSELPDWTSDEARRSFYVHIGPSLDYLAEAYQDGMAGMLAAEPFCVVGQPTVYDPDRAPAGRHVLWIMVRAVPAVIKGDAAGLIHGHSWTDQVSRSCADRVLNTVERHAPGLRRKILGMSIVTPPDLQRLNPNLVGGDLNAGSMHLSQFYGNRPIAGHSDYSTPIDNLFMCGAATWPGGGASPGSGTLLARQLLS